jgi:ribosomal protection tetracycline resistance protein
MQALELAATVVCEPVLRVRIEIAAGTIGAVLAALARLGAVAQTPSLERELAVVDAVLPAARVQDLQRQLPALTAGEGVLESEFAAYQAVTGAQPTRRRLSANPLNREEYLMHLAGRASRNAGASETRE